MREWNYLLFLAKYHGKRLLKKFFGNKEGVFYIGGSDVFPPPLKPEEEAVLLEQGYPANYQIIVDRVNHSDTLEVMVEMTPENFSDSLAKITSMEKSLVDALKSYGSVHRLKGTDRYATSVAIADGYFHNPDAVLVAYGRNFPDGLSGGPLAYAMGAPLLLTQAGKEDVAAAYVEAQSLSKAYVLGGTAAVSDETVDKIFK